MPSSPKGGPVTKTGKETSSRNALSHGLTAKKWIDPSEQESYQLYLSALNEDYQPQTLMEKTLIEKLADIRTRLERFHTVEDSLFSLAQTQAASPDIVVNSFDVEDEGVIDDVRDHALGLVRVDSAISAELFYEIVQHDVQDVSGWGYIRDRMPQLSAHIMEECRKENMDIEKLMDRYKPATDDKPVFSIRIIRDKPPEPITDQALDESGLQVRTEYFITYINELFKRTQRCFLVSTVIENFDGRTQLLKDGALPDGQSLDRIMRYRTTLERQFSKTLGELLHIIKMREG